MARKSGGDKLEMTLHYLDEEINKSSPSRMLQSESSPKPKPRFPKLTNSTLIESMNMTGPGALQLFSNNASPKRRKKMQKIKKSDLQSLSITINPDEMSALFDATMATATTLMPSAAESLYVQFQSTFQTFNSAQQVFDNIADFIEICTTTIDMISSGRGITDKRGNDISWLVNERNCWRLLYALYKDRATYQDDFDASDDIMSYPLSEKKVIEHFYRTNSVIREAQLVIDWLEQNARDEWKLLDRDDIAHYTDMTVAWENTLYQLQTTTMAYKSSRAIVESLDPDAPLRENKPLHDLDMEDEKRLLKQVFFEIRRGQIERAQELCIHCGQAWRAATLDGWRLFHDSNYANKSNDEKSQIEGNPTRDIWKLCAWKMCEDSRAAPEDKAVMGALCGHLECVLKYCTTWEDKLWAYTRAVVDVMVEREIRDNALREYVPMPDRYWSNLRTMEGILKDIQSSEETNSTTHMIEELIIRGAPSEFLVRCSQLIEDNCQPQLLRFLTHLVLIFRLLGYSEPQHLGDSVIISYVKVLINERNIDSIAYYCSLLPEEDQIEQYSNFMETITDSSERQECLQAAEKYEMNIPQITGRVVQTVRTRREDTNMEESIVNETTEEDIKKISALDWMVFYPQQRGEALWECNALLREYVALGKYETARLAFNKIPEDSPQIILEQFKCEMDETRKVKTDNLPPKIDSALKEYLCFKAYLDAQEGFAQWFHNFHRTKPLEPTKPETKDFAQQVAYEHRMNRYKEEYQRWNERMLHETKILKSQLHNVILFPGGGWLVDTVTDEEPRKTHLDKLRRLCIPQIFQLLYKVLQSMELYDEVIDIVTLLMDEDGGHYKVFAKEQLQDFVDKISTTCIAMIKVNKDPFGDDFSDDEEELPTEEESFFDKLVIKDKGQIKCNIKAIKASLEEYLSNVQQEETWEPPEDVLEIIKKDGAIQEFPQPEEEEMEEEYSDPEGKLNPEYLSAEEEGMEESGEEEEEKQGDDD